MTPTGVVLMDSHHEGLFGELVRGVQGPVVSSLEELGAFEDLHERLTVVDSRPEVWIAAAERLATDVGLEGLLIVSPQHCSVVVETLAEARLRPLTIDRVGASSGCFVTGLRRTQETDCAIEPLLTGLRVGLAPEFERTRGMLQSAARQRTPGTAQTDAVEQLRARNLALTEQVAQLVQQQQTVDATLQTLRLRYANLSSSVLGKLTVRYWNLRRRLRR